MRRLPIIIVLTAIVFGGSSAQATPNPNTVPAGGHMAVICGGSSPQYQDIGSFTSCSGTNNSASANTQPRPGATAQATNPGNFADVYNAVAGASYIFVVFGGNLGDHIPLRIDTALTQTTTPNSRAFALAGTTIYGPQGILGGGFVEICSLGCAGSGGDFNNYYGALNVTVFAGFSYTVSVEARVSNYPSELPAFAKASADPYIYIDPSFPDAAKYSIHVSPGFGNVPFASAAVPEPSSWVMMIGGLALAGGVLRRRATAALA